MRAAVVVAAAATLLTRRKVLARLMGEMMGGDRVGSGVKRVRPQELQHVRVPRAVVMAVRPMSMPKWMLRPCRLQRAPPLSWQPQSRRGSKRRAGLEQPRETAHTSKSLAEPRVDHSDECILSRCPALLESLSLLPARHHHPRGSRQMERVRTPWWLSSSSVLFAELVRASD